ncbi:hypothetical protein [Komagataeibacter xylinus]|uniref:Tail fiber protein n=1 Tax=Komagataeibacter xylinus TaxID=28448 RepID=A0A857FSF6_KOMXY|nr:hypothetical protein [Komagataeibacter xylinus]QHC36469.1 hypothetical protein FMA36_14030 [Komagataeibacter xylinus]
MVYRIDDPTAASSPPAVPSASGLTPGYFTNGNPSASLPATLVPDWWLNMVQGELEAAVKGGGLTPDKTNNGQLLLAIQALAKGAASGAVLGSPGVLATGDVAGGVLYYSAALKGPAFTYGTTTVGLLTTTALDGYVTTGALTTALAGYLSLGGGNVTGDMDWGSKTAAGTVTHRFWSAGPPATGDATPDATLTVTGGTPGTANQGTFRLSTGTFDLSGSGKVLVPDVVDFTTQEALSAKVAEARYIGSVLAAGSTDVRVTDIQVGSDGSLSVTGSDGNTYDYVQSSIIQSGAVFIERTGKLIKQVFTVTLPKGQGSSSLVVTLPVALSTAIISGTGNALNGTNGKVILVPAVNILSVEGSISQVEVFADNLASQAWSETVDVQVTVEGY